MATVEKRYLVTVIVTEGKEKVDTVALQTQIDHILNETLPMNMQICVERIGEQ